MMQNPKIRSLHQLLRNSSRKWLVAVDLIDAELLAQVLDRRGFACQVVHTGWVQLHWIANAIWRHCTTCRTDQFSVDIWQQDAHLFEFPVLQRHALECKDTVTTKHQLNRRVTQLSNELHCRKVAWGLGSCRGCHGLRDGRGGCNGLRGCRGLRSCHGLRNCRGISASSLRSRSSNRRRHCRNCFGSWRIGCTSLAIRTTSHWRRSSFAISGGSFASEELSDLWPLRWVVIQGPIGNDDLGPAGNRKKYGCLNWHAQNIKLKHNSFLWIWLMCALRQCHNRYELSKPTPEIRGSAPTGSWCAIGRWDPASTPHSHWHISQLQAGCQTWLVLVSQMKWATKNRKPPISPKKCIR